MLVYECKQCGQFTIHGFKNEYGEHFCRESCYDVYCATHGYEAHHEKLEYVNTESN
jgi:hypothetical protein